MFFSRYDPLSGIWVDRTPLIAARQKFTVSVFENKIFVIGNYFGLCTVIVCVLHSFSFYISRISHCLFSVCHRFQCILYIMYWEPIQIWISRD